MLNIYINLLYIMFLIFFLLMLKLMLFLIHLIFLLQLVFLFVCNLEKQKILQAQAYLISNKSTAKSTEIIFNLILKLMITTE